ncbi:MAG: ABC transporter permease [Actinomycetota bacterium]
MSAVWFHARAELRARWRAAAALAIVVGLAGGLVMAAAAGARRQDATFPKFRVAQNTAQAGIANSGVFFGFANVDFAKAKRLPQVVDTAPFNFFIGIARTSRGKVLTPIGDQNPVVFFASGDGRFDRVLNRMLVTQGRLSDPNAVDEVMVSYIASIQYDIHLGDTLDLTLPTFENLATSGQEGVKFTGPRLTLRVVGVEAQSYELPPGLGYPPIHMTPAFYSKYISGSPTFPAMVMKLRSDGDIPSLIDDVQRSALQPGGASTRVQFFNEPANAASIRRTLHVQATALWLLALLAGIASVLIFAQAIVRQAFVESDDHPSLHALGMTSGQLFVAAILRLALVGIVGSVLAIGIVVAASPLTPIGLARVIDVTPGVSIDGAVVVIGVASLIGVVVALGAYAAVRSSSARVARSSLPDHPSRIADALARSSFPPTSVAGVRMALETGRGRTAVPVRSTLFGAVVGLAALVTAFVFGSSLTHLLNTPRLIGWNWSATIGDSFDAENAARVLPILAQDTNVAEYSAGGASDVRIGNLTIPVVAQDQVKGAIEPRILEGRAPRAVDEIALGGYTLRSLHAHIGDVVGASIDGPPVLMKIVGRAVVPPVEEPAAVGHGGFMTFQALKGLEPKVAEDVYTVRFAAGVKPSDARAKLKGTLQDLAVNTELNIGNATDFARIVNLPVILAALLALLAGATLIHTLLTVVRRRSRDLAILKTLGFVRRQIRAAIAWQVTTLLVVALAIGIPVGIAAGRWSWTTFANQVGFVPESVVRWLPVVVTIPAAIVFGNLIAMLPARAAARTKPAMVLRTE